MTKFKFLKNGQFFHFKNEVTEFNAVKTDQFIDFYSRCNCLTKELNSKNVEGREMLENDEVSILEEPVW